MFPNEKEITEIFAPFIKEEYTNNIKNVLYCIVLTTKIMQTEYKEAKTIRIRQYEVKRAKKRLGSLKLNTKARMYVQSYVRQILNVPCRQKTIVITSWQNSVQKSL